jgi:zinc protease
LQAENVEIAVITPNAAGLKDDLVSNRPSPIRYANPNMPAAILEEDRVIQAYPLAVSPENVRIAPAAEFFKTSGIPGR